MEYNPDLIKAWQEYESWVGPMTPDVALPIWNAFKSGWDARFKCDLAMDKAAECDHCWHDTGMVLASLPPQYQKKCCRCGEIQTYRGQTLVAEDNRAHGPFNTGFAVTL